MASESNRLPRRGKFKHRDHAPDRGRLHKHVLPRIGGLEIGEVRPRHIAEFVHALRTQTDLAPHTTRNIYGLVAAMFRDDAIKGLVEANPCILIENELGEDDGGGEGAGRYTREQLVRMISAPEVPEHARVFAALGGLAGLRLGAIAGPRWRDLDTTAAPLWRLTSARTYDGKPTKTGKPSVVPVHPVLAGMFASWRDGWARMCGDLMDSILEALAIPAAPMKSHALRSTFISIALEDGARDDLIEKITQTTGRGRRAFDRYDRADYWPQLCAEVSEDQAHARAACYSACYSPRNPQ